MTMPVTEYIAGIDTPIGPIAVRADAQGIRAVEFSDTMPNTSSEVPPFITDAVRQLQEYFSGERTSFHDLPLHIVATDFQREVWDALEAIPFGATCTYGELAQRVGRPGGAQAVGQALTRNPIPVIVPCHRVVQSGGDRGGYAGGPARKSWLLEHEAPGA